MRRFRKAEGFSLIELMAVVLTLGILASIVAMQTSHVRERAKMALLMEHVRLAKTAAQRFEADIGSFPPDVARGVDPGLVSRDGWQGGDHSAAWDGLDLAHWAGPYLPEWPLNPWGGLYDWDNYPDGATVWGISGGGVYLTLKPSTWGGQDGMPSEQFELMLEGLGIDKVKDKGIVAIWMGKDAAAN